MDMFEGVGRRLDEEQGSLVEIGSHSLNGRERKVLFRNNGDGTFTDVAFVNGIARQEDGRGLSILDYNNDGQIDLLLRNYKQPTELMKNTGRGSGRWMEFKLVGTIPPVRTEKWGHSPFFDLTTARRLVYKGRGQPNGRLM